MDIIYESSDLFVYVGLITSLFFAVYLFLAVIEFFIEIHTGKFTLNYIKEISANISVLIPNIGTEIITGSFFLIIFVYIGNIIPWSITNNWMTFIVCLMLVDFLYYWEHRLEHGIRLFWSYHSVHHSSRIFHYSTALRVSFIENFTGLLYFIPAIIIGFDPVMVLISAILMLTYQSWLHNDVIPSLGIFERVFCTPSLHRVHHGNDDIYIDKNFGAIFSIWDQLFSTYQKELFKPTYGLTTQINTINPVKVNFSEFISIFKDLWNAKKSSDILGYLFYTPKWQPANCANKKVCKY